jgi:single-strand DNA-binding protein
MSETLVTVVGNVATRPDVRKSVTGTVSVRFRLASTMRRFDRERGAWTDGHTSFYTVWAWRQLGENVAASVSVGEPLVVQGRLRVREDRGPDGQRWTSAEVEAVAIGHDMTRGTSAFRRRAGARPELALPDANPAGAAARDPAADPGSGLPADLPPGFATGPASGPVPQPVPDGAPDPVPDFFAGPAMAGVSG